MDILVVGGTRFMGKHLVNELLVKRHNVTIATRGISRDNFSNNINRIKFDRLNEQSIKDNFCGKHYDVVYDSLAYCSNDIKILLDNISCNKYITISTTAVYDNHINTLETEFNPLTKTLIWCGREDFPYDEIKRQAECALFQKYSNIPSVAVRFPFVIGEDDYTKRLYFYVDHIINKKPMFIDNIDIQMAFVRSDEAGKFLAFFADNEFTGVINGSSKGTISINYIANYVKSKTGCEAILTADGEKAPYNGESEYSINTDKANSLGYKFTPLKEWVYNLIDKYIKEFTN